MRKVIFGMMIIAIILSMTGCGGEKAKYQEAMDLMETGKYEDAISILQSLDDYNDSSEQLLIAEYQYASQLFSKGNYAEAESVFEILGDYKDAEDWMNHCRLFRGYEAMKCSAYEEAIAIFETVDGNYKDAANQGIESIKCIDVANDISAIIAEEDKAPLPLEYLRIFSLDFTTDSYYDIDNYAFFYNIHYPEGFSSIIDVFSFGTTSLAEELQNSEGNGKERDIYKMFYNRGFEGITVFVNYYDYSGTLMASQSYGLDNLNQEKEEEEKQALKKAEEDLFPTSSMGIYTREDNATEEDFDELFGFGKWKDFVKKDVVVSITNKYGDDYANNSITVRTQPGADNQRHHVVIEFKDYESYIKFIGLSNGSHYPKVIGTVVDESTMKYAYVPSWYSSSNQIENSTFDSGC